MSVVATESRDSIEREGAQLTPGKNKGKGLNGDGAVWKWLGTTFGVVMLAFAAYMVRKVDGMDTKIDELTLRIAVIEANRFTSADGIELLKIINDKADKNDVPPAWFLERVQDLEDKVERHHP